MTRPGRRCGSRPSASSQSRCGDWALAPPTAGMLSRHSHRTGQRDRVGAGAADRAAGRAAAARSNTSPQSWDAAGTLSIRRFNATVPCAAWVADPFHVVRLANDALDEFRRRSRTRPWATAGTHDRLYRARELLFAASETITENGRMKLQGTSYAGDPTARFETPGTPKRPSQASSASPITPPAPPSGVSLVYIQRRVGH